MESATGNQSAQLVPAAQLVAEDSAAAPDATLTAPEPAEDASWAFGNWPDGFAFDIARATRIWIQYGMLGFAVVCIVIGAVKGILGF